MRWQPRYRVGWTETLLALFVACSRLPLIAAQSSPYSKTEHGGKDANGDGTAGALRPPNQPPGVTIDPAKFPAGECIHCHSQHASYENNTGSAQSFLLFKTNDVKLCATCHDKQNTPSFNEPWFLGWSGAQRTRFYQSSAHGSDSSGAQWVAGTSYSGVANQLNGDLATPAAPPGGSRVYSPGHCQNCHSSHGYNPGAAGLLTSVEQTNGILKHMLVRTQGSQNGTEPAEANALCNYCHDNSSLFAPGSNHDLASTSYWYKGSRGIPGKYVGYQSSPHQTSANQYNLYPGGNYYPARTGEKGLCVNCHDPHGGAPGGNINGAAGGSPASNRTLVEPMIDSSQPTVRNGLCFRCHNNMTSTSGAGVQKFQGQAVYNSSKHAASAKAFWGQTADSYDGSGTSYNQATAFWGPRASSDYGTCLNCHNPHTKTIGTASINGTNLIPNMLLDHYNNAGSQVSSYDPEHFRLCLDCHNESRLTDAANTNTAFYDTVQGNLHARHVNQGKMLCNDCHNPHGSNSAQVAGNPPAGNRDLSFSATNALPSAQSATIESNTVKGPVWFYNATVDGQPNKSGCLVKCHGVDHGPSYYTPSTSPRLVQYSFRWYFDNSGTDTSLTGGANVNTALAQAQLRGLYRLRVQVGEANNRSAPGVRFKLQYSADGGSNWADLSAQGAATAPWRYADSSYVADKSQVGAALLPATPLGSNERGAYCESSPSDPFTLRNQSEEFDLVIEPVDGQVLPSTAYQFRMVSTDAAGTVTTPLQQYTQYPTLTTSSTAKGYFEGSEGINLFSNSGYSSEIYPQFSLIAAGATVYVEAITASDGSGGKTVSVKSFDNTQVAGPVLLVRSGASPPYTYRASITLPNTSNQQYYLEVLITGSAVFRCKGPLLTVGTASPTYFLHTFSDSGYEAFAEAFAPGDTVYAEIAGNPDNSPSASNSTWELSDFQGNTVANGSPDAVFRVSASTYRLNFVMPPLTDGSWYSLQCTMKDDSGVILAQGPVKVIKESQARETRLHASAVSDKRPSIQSVTVTPVLAKVGDVVHLEVKTETPAAFGNELMVSMDSIPEDDLTRTRSSVNPSLALQWDSKRSVYSVEIPTRSWKECSSHAVYIGRPGDDGRFESLAGVVVGMASRRQPLDSSTADVLLSFFQDETLTTPLPTPGGTPTIATPGRVYIRALSLRPLSGAVRVAIDGPGDTNDVSLVPMSRKSATEFILPWDVSAGGQAAGRAQIRLRSKGVRGRTIAPGPGEFVRLFGALDRRAYLQVSSDPGIVPADGKSQSVLTARVTDFNGAPLASHVVELRRVTGCGSLLTLAATTNASGEARGRYLVGTTAETAVIEALDAATGEKARGCVRLQLSSSTLLTLWESKRSRLSDPSPAGPIITVDAFPARLPADGVSTCNLFAYVKDRTGKPLSGLRLQFQVLAAGTANGRILESRPVTDINGRAEAIYFAGSTPGEVTIVATEPLSQATGSAVVTLTGGGPARITLQATPAALPADGKSVSQLLVRVTDLLGRPVNGAEVVFGLQYGRGTLTVPYPATNALGEVTALFYAGSRPGPESITAAVLSPLPEETSDTTGQDWEGALPPGQAGAAVAPFSGNGVGATNPLIPMGSFGSGRSLPVLQFGFDGGYAREDVPDVSLNSSIASAPFLEDLGSMLSNFTLTYGRTREQADISYRTAPGVSLSLNSQTFSLDTNRPFKIGGKAVGLTIDFDKGRSLAYGFVSDIDNTAVSLRVSGRNYGLAGRFRSIDTSSQDLGSGSTTNSKAESDFLSFTLNPPRLPSLSITQTNGSTSSGSGGSLLRSDYKFTTFSTSHQLGALGLRWTDSKQDFTQATATGPALSVFETKRASVNVDHEILPGFSVFASLNRNSSDTNALTTARSTDTTNSTVELRGQFMKTLTLTASRNTSDLQDPMFPGGQNSLATQNVNLAYLPSRWASMQAGVTRDENNQSLVGSTERTSKNVSLSLHPTSRLSVNYSANSTDETGPVLLGGSPATDSKSIFLLTNLSSRVTAGSEWSRSNSMNLFNLSNNDTKSAFLDMQFSKALRARIAASNSSVSGVSEGLLFSNSNETGDLSMTWTPRSDTTVSYTFSRLLQIASGSDTGTQNSALQVSTLLSPRVYLLVNMTNSQFRQTAVFSGSSFAGWLQGKRTFARLSYTVDPRTTFFAEWERLTDEVGDLSGTKSFRSGFSTRF